MTNKELVMKLEEDISWLEQGCTTEQEICEHIKQAIKTIIQPKETENPWNTGTPTDEGWYLIAFLGANKRIEYASAVWCYNEWDAHCRVIAWQKITPYEEKQNGHID